MEGWEGPCHRFQLCDLLAVGAGFHIPMSEEPVAHGSRIASPLHATRSAPDLEVGPESGLEGSGVSNPYIPEPSRGVQWRSLSN